MKHRRKTDEITEQVTASHNKISEIITYHDSL